MENEQNNQKITISIAPKRKKKKKRNKNHTKIDSSLRESTLLFISMHVCHYKCKPKLRENQDMKLAISTFSAHVSVEKKTINQPTTHTYSSISSAVNNRCQCEIE